MEISNSKFKIQNTKWLGILIVAIIFSSCGMQKRLYTKGFYAHKTKTLKTSEIALEDIKLKIEDSKVKTKDSKLVASNSKNIETSILDFKPTDGCDTIILKNGSKLSVSIKDAGSTDIKYKTCPTSNGVYLTIKKSDVSRIYYGNGRREVFEEEHANNQPVNLPEDKFSQNSSGSYHQNYSRDENNGKTTNAFSIFGLITSFIPIQIGLIFALLTLTDTISLSGGGIAAVSSLWFIIPLLFAFISFILCLIALIQIKNHQETKRGSGMAILGLILSLIVMIVLLGLLITA